MKMEAALSRIYEERGRPGARALRTAARRQGTNVTMREAQEFVAQQNSSQVLQARLPSDGVVSATRENARWQMDLLDFSKRKKQSSGHQYALTVVDVFSRYAWVENIKDRKDAQVLTAYRKIIARNNNTHCKEADFDMGSEFGPTFQAYLKDHGTAIRRKDPASINSIALIDRTQQSIKKIMANLQADTTAQWSSLTKKATSIYNDREHGALYGENPEDVSENKPLMYILENQAGKDIKHNNDRWRAKAGKIVDKGAFRIPKKREEWERIDAPKYEGKVHTVAGLKGANVEDTEGNSFPVRKVLAVPGTSQDIDVNDELVPGSGKREDQLRGMRQYAEQLKQELSTSPQGTMTFKRVTDFLRTRPAFSDTALVYKLPKAGLYVKFLRLFKFQIMGSGTAMIVRAPAAAAGQAPVIRVVPLAPRAQRRDLPNTQAIMFQADNPKRGGSAAYTRWAVYRSATSLGEARRLGMTPQDLREAIRQGHAQLQ
jgi:hypothetical protein